MSSLASSVLSVSSVVQLEVRMALHTGAAELRDKDYFGQPLNRVARLLAVGHGGQILLSDVTQELCRDTLPAGAYPSVSGGASAARSDTRGERISTPPSCAALGVPSAQIAQQSRLPNNLPQQLTAFIGREKESKEVLSLLERHRLLTMTGSGGCGKTRLSLQVAADALEAFPDGVWLAELAPLADPAQVPQAVMQAIGVMEEADKPQMQTLTERLKTRRLLLVLDNCEHLLTACATLADALLRACPQVRILASSREPLGVDGGADLPRSLPFAARPETGAHS